MMRRLTSASLLVYGITSLLSCMAVSVPVARADHQLESVTGTDPRYLNARRGIALGTHTRLVFKQDTQRVALGNETVLGIQVISPREVLVLGQSLGQSSLTVWFADGEVEQYLFSVQQDLTILQRALREVHPHIRAEAGTDRSAVVISGTVPDVSFSVAAESVARNYFTAGRAASASNPVLPADTEANQAGSASEATEELGLDRPGAPSSRSGGPVINLIRVERVPHQLEQRMQDAIADIDVGGSKVVVERIMRGDVPGPNDTFLLTGSVRNQVALTRVLTLAGRMLGARAGDISEQIRVIADESGAVLNRMQNQNLANAAQLPGLGGGTASLQLRPQSLTNRIRENFGRAKAIELLDGRLVSFIHVDDLPQIRVSVRLYEVNRQQLKEWSPELDVIVGDVPQDAALLPTFGGNRIQGDNATQIGGGDDTDVQNSLSLLGGALVNNLQVTGSQFAVDLLFSALAEAGIARSLATPELLVLSGEVATFQVGGEVPVSTSVTTGAADRVFNSVFFVPFGVQLGVRPLVGDGDMITLDLTPQVVEPDFALTAALRETTNDDQGSTAFSSRTLNTSARLRDGQVLVIGGLLQRRSSQQTAFTPNLGSVPGAGNLARREDSDEQDRELVIVVSPSIVRDKLPGIRLWEYPGIPELLPIEPEGNFDPVSGTSSLSNMSSSEPTPGESHVRARQIISNARPNPKG